jgi:photoactive yellow protein
MNTMLPKLEMIAFDQGDIENVLARLSPAEIDTLPFGAIQLDAAGTVIGFSQREAQITSRDPKQVIGRNFFDEVAPCTRRPEFQGRFQEGVRNGNLGVVFDYVFDYKMNPTRVRVHMKKAILGETYWILVSRF